ncbi:MAG: hypothetical protein JXA96_07465 [Sedimentisphaerales bacterium]|nr:hypothetical protein [Sedimentisphaerales bacterium]
MSELNVKNETGCCPRFNPEPWQEKEVTFNDKLFIKDHVTSFLHIPLNFGKVMIRSMDKIQKINALDHEPIILCDEKSLWGSDVYIAVTKDVPEAEMAKISGTFLCKVYEGPYQNVRKWVEDMKTYVRSKSKQIQKIYFYYTTCPKCAKVYGKNYVVIMAQI